MTDAPPPPPGGPEQQSPQYGQQPPQYYPNQPPQTIIVQQEKKSRKGCWIGALVVLALGLSGCIAVVAIAGSAVGELEEQQDRRADDEALVEDAAIITRCGTDTVGWGEVAVEFTNPLDEEKGYISIEINFLDGENTVIGSATVIFENLSAGQKAIGEGTAFDLVEGKTVASCQVVDGTVL